MKELICTSRLTDLVIRIGIDHNGMPFSVVSNLEASSLLKSLWIAQARIQVKRMGLEKMKREIADNGFTVEERDL